MEGIEGSGKSTLLAGLAGRLRAAGVPVVATREPGGTALGDRLRALFVEPNLALGPVAEALVVNASRAQHVVERIEPALAQGRWVLSDRYVAATLAYQGYGRGLDLGTLRALAAIATRGRDADCTLLVDVTPELSRARVLARARERGAGIDRVEREEDAFHARVREGYLALALDDPSFVTLDGALAPEALLAAAWRILQARYGV